MKRCIGALFLCSLVFTATKTVAIRPVQKLAEDKNTTGEVVSFPSGELTLHGVLYKPKGAGPFPAVVYNHGSAPGMLSSEAFEAIGPLFASRGWVFFGPYRRGQGLSASAGPYIGDEIAKANKQDGEMGAVAMSISGRTRPVAAGWPGRWR